MRPGPLVFLLAVAAALAACGDSPSPPDQGGAVTIRGDERLGWDQGAGSAAELATLRFAIYVDGGRSELSGARCETAPTVAGFACSAQLPSMSPGTHTLELAAFAMDGQDVVESPRSPPLRVTVSPPLTVPMDTRADAPLPEPPPSPRTPDTTFERIGPDAAFDDIADASITPDGWLLVAERAGVLQAIELEQQRLAAPAVIDGTRAAGGEGSLVAVTVASDFARTGLVYVLQTAASRHGLTWQVARYRRAGETLGERAVLLQFGIADIPTSGAIAFGPDGRLYVALEDVRARLVTRRGTERHGMVLRLDADGSTPSDQLAGDPVYAAGRGEARAFDWHPETGALWTLHADAAGAARLTRVSADARRARAGRPDYEQALPSTLHAADMVFYDADTMPALQGSLLVAAESGLFRVRIDPQNTTGGASIDAMLDTPVRALMPLAEGGLFVATPQAVYRLRPQ